MKKNVLLLCALLAFVKGMANVKDIRLFEPSENKGSVKKNEIPKVRCEDDIVKITVDTTITKMEIIVVDNQCQVMASQKVDAISNMPIIIPIPSERKDEAYKVEIYFDKNKYYGYLE